MGVMECQIPPQLADTSGSHQLLDGEIAEDAEQAVIGVTHEIVEMIRGKEAETGGRATTGRSSSSESGSRWQQRRFQALGTGPGREQRRRWETALVDR